MVNLPFDPRLTVMNHSNQIYTKELRSAFAILREE